MAIGGLWIVVGIYFDLGWHVRNDVDSFLTWAHAVLYAGLLATFAVAGIATLANARRGYSWLRGLPAGYELAMPGIALFFVAGALDGIGHTLWGFESGFEALLSPTHQAIGVAIILLLIGPIRSAIAAGAELARRDAMPAVLSLGALFALVRWGTNPFFETYAESRFGPPTGTAGFTPDTITFQSMHFAMQSQGLASVLLSALFLAAFSLYLVRVLDAPRGALTLVLLVGNGMTSLAVANTWPQAFAPIVASLVAGIAGEFLIARPGISVDVRRQCALAFFVPFVYHAVVLASIALAGGTWWDPIFLFGAMLYSGMFGLLLALAVVARSRSL